MVNFEIRYKSGYGGGPEEMLIEPLQNIYLKHGFCLNMIDTPLCPLKVMTNLQEAVWDADIVVNGLPSTETCEIFEETNKYWKERINPPIIISLSKGIEVALDPVPRIITSTQMINWDAVKGNSIVNSSCRDVWTEYHDMGFGGFKAVAEYKAYIAEEILELHQFVAPKMMARGSGHFSYGITENLDNPKYKHYKYWFNPLETKCLC